METERRIRKMQRKKEDAGRYLVRIGKHYYDAYNKMNPSGLPNDAGAQNANAKCNNAGRMTASKVIEEGQEIYWCYGVKYWKVWGPRANIGQEQAQASWRHATGGLKKVGQTRRAAPKKAKALGAGRRAERERGTVVERVLRSRGGPRLLEGKTRARGREDEMGGTERDGRNRKEGRKAAEDAPT